MTDTQLLKACANLAGKLAKDHKELADRNAGPRQDRHDGMAEAYENVRRWLAPTEAEEDQALLDCI